MTLIFSSTSQGTSEFDKKLFINIILKLWNYTKISLHSRAFENIWHYFSSHMLEFNHVENKKIRRATILLAPISMPLKKSPIVNRCSKCMSGNVIAQYRSNALRYQVLSLI